MKVGPREKRFIIIGLGIIAVAALVYALMLPQPDSLGLTSTLELKKKRLKQQKETIDLEGVYESRLQLYNTRLQENRSRLLPGATPNAAGGELLKILTDFSSRSGVEITRTWPIKEEKVEDRLIKISAQISTSCSLDQFVQLLTEISNYRRFLTVDVINVSVRAQLPPRGRSRTPTNTAVIASFTPTLTVSGYFLVDKTETEEAGTNTNS